MDIKWIRALGVVLCLAIVGWITSAAIESHQEFKSSWCHEGLQEAVGTDAMLTSDNERINDFIRKTGIHLYVYSYEWTPYGANSAQSPEDFVLQMYRMCSKQGFPFPGWESTAAFPDNSIFMAYEQYHTNDGSVVRAGGFVSLPQSESEFSNLTFSVYESEINKFYDESTQSFKPGYESATLNVFLNKAQQLIDAGIPLM